MTKPISVKELWLAGKAIRRAEQASGEAAKLGTLRGGSAGCVIDESVRTSGGVSPATQAQYLGNSAGQEPIKYLGKCARKSHLRSLGIQDEVEVGKNLMFDSGFDNEDEWMRALKLSWQGPIKREEEIPTKWYTSNGVAVTGRPDIVLCENVRKMADEPDPGDGTIQCIYDADEPRYLIELKKISSIWTMNNVHYKLIPSTDHIVQSCHYMWQLGVQGSLVYSSAVDWHVPYNMRNSWRGRQDIEYKEDRGKSEPFKVVPFIREYFLEIRNGSMWYFTEGLPEWVETVVTVDGVRAYYELVSKIGTDKKLQKRPAQINSIGLKASYNECDFCPFRETCDQFESDYERWLDEIKAQLGSSTINS